MARGAASGLRAALAPRVLSAAGVALLLALAAHPHPHDVPVRAAPPTPPPPLEGAWAPDDALNDAVTRVAHGQITSAETVFLRSHDTCDDAFATDSRGRVWALPPLARAKDPPTLVAHVGGTLLGGAFDRHGGMYLADATRGLLYLPANESYPAVGKARIVASLAPAHADRAVADADLDATELRYTNDIAIDKSTGLVYFTDSTRVAPLVTSHRRGSTFQSFSTAHLAGDATGRLLVYVPTTGDCFELATGIRFANGVGVSKDGSHVIVASTSSYALYKVPTVPADITAATAPRPVHASKLELFTEAPMPVMPDGLSVDPADGSVWVGSFGPVPLIMRAVDKAPAWLRHIVVRIPHKLRPKSSLVHSVLLHFSPDGRLLRAAHDRTKQLGLVTSAERCGDRVYSGSLHGMQVLNFDLSKL